MADHKDAIAPISAEQARAQLAAIVDSSDDAIISKALDGTILTWNRGAERLYGYGAREAVGRNISMLMPTDRYQEYQRLRELMKRGERLEHLETVRLRKDGRLIDVSLTLSPILAADGAIIGVSAVARDITERKRMEQSLRESEKRYRTLVEMAQDAVVVHQEGRFVYTNCAALGIFGARSLEELQRASLLDLVHPEERDALRARIQQLLEGEEIPLREYRLRRLNGAEISVEASSTLIDYQGKPSIQVIAREITERKRAEQEREIMLKQLDYERSRFEAVVHQLPVGVMIAEAPSGRLIYDNEQSRRIFRQEFQGAQNFADYGKFWKICRPDGSPLPAEEYPLARAVRGGTVIGEEYRIGRGDGSQGYVCVNAAPILAPSGEIVSGLAAFDDITESKAAEEALKTSEETLKLAVQTTGLGIFDLDLRSGKGVWSDIAKRHYGLPPEAEPDLEMLMTGVHPEDRERVRQIAREAAKPGGSGEYSAQYRTIGLTDGKLRWLTMRARHLFNGSGEPVRLVGTCLDITDIVNAEKALKDEIMERLRAVEALAKQEQLLIRQGRLAAMGEMIGNIAHQWRQPLNTLALLIQELPRYYERNMFSKEYLENSATRAMQVINYMSKTIDGFRNFIGPDREKEEFRVSEVLARTISIVEAAFSQLNLRIEVEAEDDIVIYGCPNEFSQVLLNILVNAKDAVVERRITEPLVTVRLFQEEGRMVLTIADNAGGIPPEIMDRIFDPYFTTKGSDQGTGIGLFMSKTIIEKNMNGTLMARNTETGAEFRIEV